jgi:hypothetical protein
MWLHGEDDSSEIVVHGARPLPLFENGVVQAENLLQATRALVFCKKFNASSVDESFSPAVPMAFETTQKLSFMPVCPAPKEDMPWARKAKYCPPSVKFAKETVAKLSYRPPGCFIDDNGFCCNLKCGSFPRASC